MNHTKTRTSQAGFSLVELMVVVAIIGVLAAIAIPSVNKYIAKSRQTEARTNLSSLYTSEKAFFAEYSSYDSRFGAIGYVPEGQLRYNIGFSGPGTQAGPGNGYTLTPAIVGVSAAAVCNNTGTGTFTNGCAMAKGATNVVPPAISAAMCPASPSAVAAGCTTNATATFQAGAAARISSAGVDDYWAIDSSKSLRNTQDGIR